MHGRRRPHSTSAPQPPSASALIAATAVYRPATPSLAAAAAGVALRNASASPAPSEQRTGSIPTKRMLKRRDSYSSIQSDSDQKPQMQRRVSSGSLTERKFRKRSPVRRGSVEMEGKRLAVPTQRAKTGAERKQESSAEESSADGDGDDNGFGRPGSLRSNTSTRSFPTTMRGSRSLSRGAAPKEKKAASTNTGSMLSRKSLRDSTTGSGAHRRRASDSDVPMGPKRRALQKPPLASGGTARLDHDDCGDSVNSLTLSELESIAEDDTMDMEVKRIPTKILEDSGEEFEDTFDFSKKKSARESRESNAQNRKMSGKGKQPSYTTNLLLPSTDSLTQEQAPTHDVLTRIASHSPSRTKFSLSYLEATPPKHTPPPRSVSPAKSALKHAISSSPSQEASGPSTIAIPVANAHSEISSIKKGRVSFSDGDSIASFSAYSRSPLVSGLDDAPRKLLDFRSIGKGSTSGVVGSGMVPTVLAPSPPTSNSSAEDLEGVDTGSVVRWPRRQAPLGKTTERKLDDEVTGQDTTTPESTPERAANVPELVLILPTPKEEKQEIYLPGGFPSSVEDGYYGHGLSIDAIANGETPEWRTGDIDKDSDSDSFSGDSIYSDAHEDLTIITTSLEILAPTVSDTLDAVPLSAVRPRSGSVAAVTSLHPTPPNQGIETKIAHTYKDDPPLPPDFLKSPTARNTATNGASNSQSRARSKPVQQQYSSPSSSTVSFSDDGATDDDDAASVLSESSFRRISPWERRTGMMSSMRSAPSNSYDSAPTRAGDTGKLSKSSTTKSGGMLTSLRNGAAKPAAKPKSRFADSDSDSPGPRQKAPFKSRFAGDSDDELPGGAGSSGGKLRKRTDSANTNGTTVKSKGGKKGFWSMFSKKGKKKSEMVLPDEVEDILAAAGTDVVDKEIGKEMPGGKGVIAKKPKSKPAQQEKEGIWVGGNRGVTTTHISGGLAIAKEVGMGHEEAGMSGVKIENGERGAVKKRKKFTRLRRILGLNN